MHEWFILWSHNLFHILNIYFLRTAPFLSLSFSLSCHYVLIKCFCCFFFQEKKVNNFEQHVGKKKQDKFEACWSFSKQLIIQKKKVYTVGM